MSDWQPMETAPRDGTPILGWCKHDSDPYFNEDQGTLTPYGCHCEGVGHVEDGPHALQWGGEAWDYDEFNDRSIRIPSWWFRYGSDYEEAASPTCWKPIHPPEES